MIKTKSEITQIKDALKKQDMELSNQETPNVLQAAFKEAINSETSLQELGIKINKEKILHFKNDERENAILINVTCAIINEWWYNLYGNPYYFEDPDIVLGIVKEVDFALGQYREEDFSVIKILIKLPQIEPCWEPDDKLMEILKNKTIYDTK